MEKKEALIVGINSFLGNAIYKRIKGEFNVVGVYNRNIEKVPEDIELIQIQDVSSVRDRNFLHVYIVSSFIPSNLNSVNTKQLIDTNLILPQAICNIFPHARIIFFSSVSVYDNIVKNDPIKITDWVSPNSEYAISKLWGENIIKKHPSYSIIRISSMYGIGMKNSTFIPKIIESAFVNKAIKLLGNGTRLQNYIHVDDVAEIAIRVAKKDENLTIFAVSSKSYTNTDIAEVISENMGCDIQFSGIDNSDSKCYDNSFTIEKLGDIAFKNIKEGLKELIEWRRKEF